MKIFIHPITFLILVSATIAEDSSSTSNQSNLRRRRLIDKITFDDPTHHGLRLDWCLNFRTGCGKAAADAYCKSKSYGEATDYPKRRTYTDETLTLEDQATCTPAHNTCDTFE